jgi:GNAT superfamily N-acetyltransferase
MLKSDISLVAAWMAEMPLWQRYHLTRVQLLTDLEEALIQNDLLLVAVTDSPNGQACGIAWCVPNGAFARSPYLRMFGVRETHSGQGVGSAMMQQIEQLVRQSSKQLFLLVSDFNNDAQRFYQKWGFQRIGVVPGFVLPDIDEYIYWKRFTEA